MYFFLFYNFRITKRHMKKKIRMLEYLLKLFFLFKKFHMYFEVLIFQKFKIPLIRIPKLYNINFFIFFTPEF